MIDKKIIELYLDFKGVYQNTKVEILTMMCKDTFMFDMLNSYKRVLIALLQLSDEGKKNLSMMQYGAINREILRIQAKIGNRRIRKYEGLIIGEYSVEDVNHKDLLYGVRKSLMDHDKDGDVSQMLENAEFYTLDSFKEEMAKVFKEYADSEEYSVLETVKNEVEHWL